MLRGHTIRLGIVACMSAMLVQYANALTLHVGPGQEYATLTQAASAVSPGDTILVHEGVHAGGLFIADLQGTASAWIYILADGDAVFQGGTNAWQLTDAAYLHIRGFTFRQQTGNGLNFDDGGSYETPAHHIIFEDCIFRDMDAVGNNDLLKLSGLDSFEIRNCIFLNGATGGSGIDMVGCHDGSITGCYFENMGSNAIQAKGGTHRVRIEANFFKNAGQRSLNLGGSTGLPFFRPVDAPYEAADLKVYSNIFIGSMAPVAFVGCINSEVVNNTLYLPQRWAMRILQETVDETRFPPCGYNTFRNNIIYLDAQVSVECNIGPNTAPETFTFSNNLWYRANNPNWNGPNLPVADTDNIINEDPLFENAGMEDFSLRANSPAIGNGYPASSPQFDFNGDPFITPRSMGAFEGGEIVSPGRPHFKGMSSGFSVWPNPANDRIIIRFSEPLNGDVRIKIILPNGQQVDSAHLTLTGDHEIMLDIPKDVFGMTGIAVIYKERSMTKWVMVR